jgi:hypothetical protein
MTLGWGGVAIVGLFYFSRSWDANNRTRLILEFSPKKGNCRNGETAAMLKCRIAAMLKNSVCSFALKGE